ncbi:hypothetical protein [Alistipes dispar]|uniref:Lipoprotein n=1 Tax=Alistipes dispar TaxID=2585119 RepID=A0A4Y1X0W7_9BACT|nr:hypothetical protein [Alistipes dispar]BBL06374.1 hypothetical protein A5CPEGH6_10120 [Alistipes dispar]
MRTSLRILFVVLAACSAALLKQGSAGTAAADTRRSFSQYCFDASGFPGDLAAEAVRTSVPAPSTRALRKSPETRQRTGGEAPEAFGLPSFCMEPGRRPCSAAVRLFAGRGAVVSHRSDYLRFGILRI